MARVVDSVAAFRAAHATATRLLDAGNARGAIAFAEALGSAPGHDANVRQIRAAMYTDGGLQLRRRDLVERGATLWRKFSPNSWISYNLANAELATWQLAVEADDLANAWQYDRGHLHAARDGFDRVAADTEAPKELRLQALTNAGNSYDIVGRYLDALTRYDRAIAMDPSFGMALGNRGIALRGAARFMGEHAGAVLRQARLALDAAIANKGNAVRFGGKAAVNQFEEQRALLKSAKPRPEAALGPPVPLRDAHLDWSLKHGLFLHVSHECIRDNRQDLDAVVFRSLMSGLTESEEQRVHNLVDAFNAIKQDYVTARYLAWLALDPSGPIRDQMEAVTKRVSFLDTLTYSRFGVRTGVAIQTFAAAVDLLDKVSSFVHLYFETGRVRDVYFSSISRGKGRGNTIAPELAGAMGRPEHNHGLLALCDLSSDTTQDTPLKRHVARRHAATHRFVAAHMMMTPPSTEWLDHVEWNDLGEELIAQLHIARGAIIYLARAIDVHEVIKRQTAPGGGLTVPYTVPRVDTELMERE